MKPCFIPRLEDQERSQVKKKAIGQPVPGEDRVTRPNRVVFGPPSFKSRTTVRPRWKKENTTNSPSLQEEGRQRKKREETEARREGPPVQVVWINRSGRRASTHHSPILLPPLPPPSLPLPSPAASVALPKPASQSRPAEHPSCLSEEEIYYAEKFLSPTSLAFQLRHDNMISDKQAHASGCPDDKIPGHGESNTFH